MRDRSTSRGAGLLAAAAVLAMVVAVALPVTGVVWWLQRDARAEVAAAEAEDRAILDAATRITMAWATVDHRSVDDYVETVKEGATGAFLEEFSASEKTMRALLEENKSIQVPTIPKDGAGILEHKEGSDTAVVLVAMDATVSNTSTKEPQPREYRLRVTLSEVKGEWRVSGMEFIDAQA